MLYKKLSFDPARDLRPVGLTARFHLLLTVKGDSPTTSARDFIERARAAPGMINYGSPGLGSPHHLAMERLSREAGIKLTHVPYRGMAPVITDMLGGVVEAAIVDYAAGNSVLRAGTLRPLAVCSASRLDALPEVPTVQEALGLRGFEAFAWQGLVVPTRTPDAIVARLTEALASSLGQESVRTRMREIGLDPLTGGLRSSKPCLKPTGLCGRHLSEISASLSIDCVELLDAPARGYVRENYGGAFSLPERGRSARTASPTRATPDAGRLLRRPGQAGHLERQLRAV